ncbi:MAG: ABC transporter ATP-binding protein [Chloroflexi bacterium]|nr:ABC transporter ATP-binding protein [Chloroflexota bacterium]MBP8054320.1 ABC transporter ATP-binding protein [Chloroflexota bacterium]
MPSVISIQNVNKVFNQGSAEEVIALKDINLEIQPGEFVSLIGPSGCGKSTLLRLIADLGQPTGGTLTVNGKTPGEARRGREYGFVFQAATLYEWRTIQKNVQLPLEIMGYSSEERDKRTQKMLEMVELGKFANHYPWQLSGGMQQRASIARALAFEPKLLLMDEPFGALDEFTRDRMNMELLRIWQQTNITIVFVTHSISEAVFLSNRVVVMSARPGRIKDVIAIDLPQPRVFETREEPAYYNYITQVRESLRDAFQQAR